MWRLDAIEIQVELSDGLEHAGAISGIDETSTLSEAYAQGVAPVTNLIDVGAHDPTPSTSFTTQ